MDTPQSWLAQSRRICPDTCAPKGTARHQAKVTQTHTHTHTCMAAPKTKQPVKTPSNPASRQWLTAHIPCAGSQLLYLSGRHQCMQAQLRPANQTCWLSPVKQHKQGGHKQHSVLVMQLRASGGKQSTPKPPLTHTYCTVTLSSCVVTPPPQPPRYDALFVSWLLLLM